MIDRREFVQSMIALGAGDGPAARDGAVRRAWPARS